MSEIKIIIDNTIRVAVVDILEFDQDNKIKQVRAYKR